MRGNGRIFARKNSSCLWCAYYLRGKEYRESTGTADRKQAEKFLKRRLKEVGADQIGARPFVGPQRERITVGELCDALAENYRLRGKHSKQLISNLARVREHFGAMRAVALSADTVAHWVNELRSQDYAPATCNRYSQLLSQAYNLAIRNRVLVSRPNIERLSEAGNARKGFVSRMQLNPVVADLPVYLRDLVLFAFLSSWRREEILSLTWDDVDGDTVRLRAEHSKEREARWLALEGELFDLIARRRSEKNGPLVFHHNGHAIGDFRKAWRTASIANGLGAFYCRDCRDAEGRFISKLDAKKECARCGKQWRKEEPTYIGLICHDLRRSGVRDMIRAGVAPHVAMSISGHKTDSMLRRYAIISEADQRAALRRTEEFRAAESTADSATGKEVIQ